MDFIKQSAKWSALLLSTQVMATESIRVATFNVSMEALNYTAKDSRHTINGSELKSALLNQQTQIKNIAEIIQKVSPDIILLNEFDNANNSDVDSIELFQKHYLSVSQNQQAPINFPYIYLAPVNTGVLLNFDSNKDGEITRPADTHGFGHFPGHFSMVLLSKYPIDTGSIRTFQQFKWADMPGALQPKNEKGNNWYGDDNWSTIKLSSKSHWDIPVKIGNETVHVLASHPTPPVFDGPEDRNGKRNHDEIRFWVDYITPDKGAYIYDDNGNKGGIKNGSSFVFLGDLNASATEGDAINTSIVALLDSPLTNDPMPQSQGAKSHTKANPNAPYHTAYWRMRADYVVPSTHGIEVKNSGVFWPEKTDPDYRLISSRQASSDHRLVWADIVLTPSK